MTKAKKLICATSLITLAATAQPDAALADWTARFTAPSSASSALKIDLPDDLDVMTLTTLGIELDGMDVTALLSLEGGDFIYSPPAPFTAGAHKVRLVVLNGDGTVSERGSWDFSITGDAGAQADTATGASTDADEKWLRSASVTVNTETELSGRMADANLATNHDRGIVSGAGNLAAHFENGNWSASTDANYMLMSEKDLSQTGNVLDLGEYNVKLAHAGGALTSRLELGHQDIGLENFLFSSFNRRGASLSADTNNNRVSAKAFALRPESQVGGRAFTGVDDSDHRLDGGMFSFRPFSASDDALKVTGVYYTGEGSTDGTAITETGTNAEGTGWGSIIEKGFANGRGTLRGEYARSKYDADGAGTLVGENNSDAFSLSGNFRPFERLILWERDADLTIGLRYDRVDTFFQSLGNAGLPSDRDTITAFSGVIVGAFSGNLTLKHETNNVDDLATMPTDRTRSVALDTYYSFDQQSGKWAWLGAPYLNFGAITAWANREDTPVAYTGPWTDNSSNSVTLGLGSNYDRWNWSASHMATLFEDNANAANDTLDNLTSLSANWTLSERAFFSGGVQFGTFRDDTANMSNYNTNVMLGGGFNLIPEKLDFSFDYNLNLATGSNDTPDRNVLNSELEWMLLPSSANSPGLAFVLRGSMEDNHEDTTALSNETNYQLFSVFRIKAPYAYRY